MITKTVAAGLHGTLYHATCKNADGTPCRCRVTGMQQTWKRDPSRWRLPVKYGLRVCFDIGPTHGRKSGSDNRADWLTAEQLADPECVKLHVAYAKRECPLGVLMDYVNEHFGIEPDCDMKSERLHWMVG